MSTPGLARQAATLLAGRWQIPVALAAAAVGSVTLLRMMPRNPVTDFSSLLADVEALEAAGASVDAADAIANLLDTQPPLAPTQRAELHDRLADLIYRREISRSFPNLSNARLLLNQHQDAMRLGCLPSARRSLRAACAAEWLGDELVAIPAYQEVLEQAPLPEQRRWALQGLVRLLEGRPDQAAQRQRLLDGLLADEGVSAGYLWWALQQSLQSALDDNDTVRARLLLAKYGHRLKTSDLKGYADYLWAWVMVHEGRPEEAEPLARWIDEWLAARGAGDSELDAFGHLPAMNRWLLGQIHLAQHQPQAALASFDEAAALQPCGDLFVAATAGQARALAELERHRRARQVVREAAVQLAATPAEERRGLDRLRGVLSQLSEQREAQADWVEAAGYLVLAAKLTPEELTDERAQLLERLGQAYQGVAGATDDPELKREYLDRAGEHFEQAAQLAQSDESHYAALLWSAAQAYDEGGRITATRRILRRFLEGRSADARLPRALLSMGQAFEADGLFEEALWWYGRLDREFAKLEEAYRAKVRCAWCLRALGRAGEAELKLREVLEDDNIAPQAQEFHDALLELCDLLYEQGRHADAISGLEDFATLYPDDPARYRSRFMLADAYRRSAYALRASPPPNAGDDRISATVRARFARAAELFNGLLADLPAGTAPDELLAQYERLALFYQADCLFELNEPATLQQALELYRSAAVRYEREPPALTAQVQVANIHLRLGMLTEAARAVERARWLLRNIPDSAFEASADGADREHWDRYLTGVSSSDLFRRVFAGAGR